MVSAIAALTVPGFFENATREFTLLAGILMLIWLPSIPVPKGLRRLTVVLASASLYAYLVHWLVYPPLAGISPALAVAASLAAGAAYWALCSRVVERSHPPADPLEKIPQSGSPCRLANGLNVSRS